MSINVIMREMTAGFGQTCLIFFMTLVLSLPLGLVMYFGRVSKIKLVSGIVQILYISYEGNSVDAAAFGVVLCTILFMGNEYRRI